MGDELELVTHRHKLFVKDNTSSVLQRFCEEALHIPTGWYSHFHQVQDMDSYWVYMRNGVRFMVSGPELVQWEYDNKACEEDDTR